MTQRTIYIYIWTHFQWPFKSWNIANYVRTTHNIEYDLSMNKTSETGDVLCVLTKSSVFLFTVMSIDCASVVSGHEFDCANVCLRMRCIHDIATHTYTKTVFIISLALTYCWQHIYIVHIQNRKNTQSISPNWSISITLLLQLELPQTELW